MTSTSPATEREFPIYQRGSFRELLLANYRVRLRTLMNPDTNVLFTEDEIATATKQHSEAYIKADNVDALCMIDQQRALWIARQLDPNTASTSSLQTLWSEFLDLQYLQPAGGSGDVTAPCPAGTTFKGSTTVPDPAAVVGTDPSSLRYQVLFTVTSPLDGSDAVLTLIGIDTGELTNLVPGTKISWLTSPDNVAQQATVLTQFKDGIGAETDAQFVKRFLSRLRHKQGAGNNAQMRAWAEDSVNNAIELGAIYACAFHAGSVLICIVGKRGTSQGPHGRIPSAGTLAEAISELTSPGSPVVPLPPFILVTVPQPQACDLGLLLAMPLGSDAGWFDTQPWPTYTSGATPAITAVNVGANALHIQVNAPSAPLSTSTPSIMVWNDAISRFEKLNVSSIAFATGTTYDVILASPPSKVLAVGDVISPYAKLADPKIADTIGTTIEAYFDSLGPGEVVDLAADSRANRAFRFPKPTEEYPQRAGRGVLTFLEDALGSILGDDDAPLVSRTTPDVPADPASGPNLIVCGRVGIYNF